MSQLYVGVPIDAVQYCALSQHFSNQWHLDPQTDKGITGSSIHWGEAMGNPLGNPLRSY